MSLLSAAPLSEARLKTEGLWLTLGLALLMAPHWQRLPLLCMGLATVWLLMRGLQLHGLAQAWPRWSLGVGVGLAFAATWVSHSTLWSKDAGVSLAVMLTALKNLETRERRDVFVVVLASLLLMLTHFLYSQAFALTVLMGVVVWGLLATLVRVSNPVQDPGALSALAQSAKMVLWGSPVLVVLFVFFPRVGPLWGMPETQLLGQVGLNDRLQLGDIAELTQDDRVALRIHWLEGASDPRLLYLRGPILSRFDGAQWTVSSSPVRESTVPAAAAATGLALDYEIFLEPSALSSVPTVETTTTLEAASNLPLQWHEDGSWTAQAPLDRPQRLRAKGQRSGLPVAPLSPAQLAELLYIPAGSNPRTVAWARAQLWASLAHYPAHVVRQLMQEVVMQKFRYTLSGLDRTGAPAHLAIDAFWLDTREGYCEHFAAAFTLILRSVGIPARIVTGYQGADIQALDAQWVVRQNRAHAWVEYWHPQTGWQRVDPTTAMLPEQIAREPGLRPPAGMSGVVAQPTKNTFWQTLHHSGQWIQHQWRMNVLGYSNAQQMDLLKHLGWRQPGHTDMLWASGLSVLGLLSAWAMWQALRRPRANAWQQLYADLARWLQQAGLGYPEHTPPRTVAQLAQARWGAAAQPLSAALHGLDQMRFGRQATDKVTPALKVLRQQIRKAIAQLPAPPLRTQD